MEGEKMEEAQRFQQIFQEIDQVVTDSGHIIMINNPEEDLGYCYTIGLSEGGWPEIIISGVTGENGCTIMNKVVTFLRKSERRPVHNMMIEEPFNMQLKFKKVSRSSILEYAHLGLMRNQAKYQGKLEFEMVQLIWPDIKGYFPDNPLYDCENNPQAMI
jgi:hypothetical protein